MLSSRAIEAPTADRESTFARLIDRSLDRYYRLATVILGDPIEAEDAVHDAAVMAWRGFAALRDVDRFDAWFGRILVNGCRDRLRARRRRPVITALPVLGSRDTRVPDDAIADVANRDALGRAFARLEPEHVVIIVLRFYEDLSVAAISDRLRIPEGTVKSRLHHAVRRMRTAVDHEMEHDR